MNAKPTLKSAPKKPPVIDSRKADTRTTAAIPAPMRERGHQAKANGGVSAVLGGAGIVVVCEQREQIALEPTMSEAASIS